MPKIKAVQIRIWIYTDKGNQFDNCNKAEELLQEVTKFIKDKGYHIPEKVCGDNPDLFISIS